MAEVRLENVTKNFDKNIIGLKDFNLEVKDREFVTILGPSGSGKSTALRVIAGLERQDRGNVFIDGQNVNTFPPQQRNVAFVFQSYALYPNMDVYENIAVGLRIKGYSKQEIQERVHQVTELLEIEELLKRKPKALSGGQRQRVALARAIAKRPRVFLLDEPLSNLDALLREKMRSELKILFKKIGGTVIYVTHDQIEAISLSDKIVLIDKGRLRQAGTADSLYYQPKDIFVATFLGSPAINIFEVSIEEGRFIYGSIRWEIPDKCHPKIKDRNKLILGVRPEDIKIHSEPKTDTFPARISVVEKIAKYAILNLDWQGKILKAIVDRDSALRFINGDVWIEFDKEKLYLFDKDTQELL